MNKLNGLAALINMVFEFSINNIQIQSPTGEDGDGVARLPIPNAHRLVVGGADDPGMLFVEECGADVVEVTEQCEDALALFVVPHLVVEGKKQVKKPIFTGKITHFFNVFAVFFTIKSLKLLFIKFLSFLPDHTNVYYCQ